MESIEAPEEAKQPQRRLALTAEATFIVAALCIVSTLVEGILGLANGISRAVFPYADNQWSEGPLALELQRTFRGEPAFLSTFRVNSYDYGPVYIGVLNGLRALAGHPFDVVWFRLVTMTLGMLALIPLALCGIAVARRAGVTIGDRAGWWVAIAVAVGAGAAVISQGITFDSIHPDNLSYLFIASALAVYYRLAAGRLAAPWVLAIVAFSLLAVFAKQSSFTITPLLVAGLAVARRLPVRWVVGSLIAYAVALAGAYFVLPGDEVDWIFRVPAAHQYQLNLGHVDELIGFLTQHEPFLGVLLVLFPLALIFIVRAEGLRALWIDGAVFLALLAASLAGFFKALGAWNNLTLIGVAMVPYFAALLAVLVTPRILSSAPKVLAFATLGLVLAVPLGLTTPPKQVADDAMMAQMRAVAADADALCRTKQPIAVTVFPELFFDCPTATFTLMNSLEELRAAYPRYYRGKTDADLLPTATYAVDIDAQGLPPEWVGSYKLQRRLPAVNGWGSNYFPVQFEVFKLK